MTPKPKATTTATTPTLRPVPDRADQALARYNFPPEKLQAYARTIARTKHMAGHEDRREDLVSYLVETGLRYATKYNPQKTATTNTYTFSSWLYDILEKRANDFFRKQAEGYADTRPRYKTPKQSHELTDPDTLTLAIETDALEKIVSDQQRQRFETAAHTAGLTLAEWVVMTLEAAA